MNKKQVHRNGQRMKNVVHIYEEFVKNGSINARGFRYESKWHNSTRE